MHLVYQQKHIYFLFYLLFISTSLFGQYTIKGNLKTHQEKYNKLFLEYLPSFHDLNSLNANNVINSCIIDDAGNFILQGEELPSEKSLYRLGLNKQGKGVGISSGLKRSYLILALDNNSAIEINNCRDTLLGFSFCDLKGEKSSESIQVIFDKIIHDKFKAFRNSYPDLSETKKQFIGQKYTDELKLFADTTTNILPALVALGSLEDLEREYKSDPAYFEAFIDKWVDSEGANPYFEILHKEILLWQSLNGNVPKAKASNSEYLLFLLLFLLIACMAYIIWLRKQLSDLRASQLSDNARPSKLEALSKKEKEVLGLMLENKSNKEIASELYIETNTVKSHITKIYQKLGVSSRKDLFSALKGS